ncbi:hypothetical protein GTP46_26865 [Duganella sp. FT135W]|uniref:Phosphate ABC transporter substrate-binding protein n=1 Tax=Duganella flavida TaxID=2692175 RepID=A0A6L8KHN6_9BURK|nr:hypothetical protein [Duganella flavida]MYM26257.1 hypothetical protein [Duganella flavida]
MNQLICATITAALATAAPLTAAETVVIVNQKNPATRMFSDQAAQFFLGKSSIFRAVDQPESAAIRADFYRKIADMDAGQVKAIWAKLVFTGKATPPKQYANSAEVKRAVAADPKAIGYIEKSDVDDTVKVILTLP